MTKPSNFIMNSDYLSLAQKSNSEFTVIFAPESFPSGSSSVRTQDITVPSTKGAIDEILMSRNNGDYRVGGSITIDSNSPFMAFDVYRANPSTLRVRLWVHPTGSGSYSMPMQTLKIRVSSFLPPNVF